MPRLIILLTLIPLSWSLDFSDLSSARSQASTIHQFSYPIVQQPDGSAQSLRGTMLTGIVTGATVLILGAIHGNEITGSEIIRQFLEKRPNLLKGSLILIPVVNEWGFLNRSRMMPDRRDLNRSFAGSPNGSQAGRLANSVVTLIEQLKPDLVMDLHSAGEFRFNLPQIRCRCPKGSKSYSLAEEFSSHLILNQSSIIDGSLRNICQKMQIPYLLYEAGEANRLDEDSINSGLSGIMRVLSHLGMLSDEPGQTSRVSLYFESSRWLRAGLAGMFISRFQSGDTVEKGAVLGEIYSTLGTKLLTVTAPDSGFIIGHATSPLVASGDPLFHIADHYFAEPGR